MDAGILKHAERSIRAVGRNDQAQAPALPGGGKVLLLVTRRDPQPVGHDPYLQEVHQFLARGIELAVGDAAARAHHLHVAGADHRAGAHRVLVFQRTLQHIGEYFHVPVRMRAEARAGLDAIVIDHQQVGETDLLWIMVAAEGKRVP